MAQQPDFGARVRQRRLELGLSQQQLAGEIVTPSYISLLESGKREPTLNVIIHLARRLKVSLEELTNPKTTRPQGQEPPHPSGQGTPDTNWRFLLHLATDDLSQSRNIEKMRALLQEVRAQGNENNVLEIGLHLQVALKRYGLHTERAELLTELLATRSAASSGSMQTLLMTQLAIAQRDAKRLADARSTAKKAIPKLVEARMSDSTAHVQLLGVLISILCELNDLRTVADLIEEMLRIAKTIDNLELLGWSLWGAAIAEDHLGKHNLALEHITEAHGILLAGNMSLQEWLRFCRSYANVLINSGNLSEADWWLKCVADNTALVDLEHDKAALTNLCADYEYARGNLERAAEMYKSLRTGALEGFPRASAWLREVNALYSLGRREEALSVARQGAEQCEEAGAYPLALRIWRRIDKIRESS